MLPNSVILFIMAEIPFIWKKQQQLTHLRSAPARDQHNWGSGDHVLGDTTSGKPWYVKRTPPGETRI